ncbi:MAG: Carboxypeptidase regulatory-like domain [Chlorobi bacterium]|nr:Carboxypeptidase regulatory-like domain [Chlorobiota bacterium]
MKKSMFAFIALLIAPVVLHAQAPRERLVGRIVDGNGASLPGAVVAIAGTALRGISGADGSYSIEGVPPGDYEVTVAAHGYYIITNETPTHVGSGWMVHRNFELMTIPDHQSTPISFEETIRPAESVTPAVGQTGDEIINSTEQEKPLLN